MSGSTRDISREKGGVQVREMVESSGIGVAVREPTAGRRPTIWKIITQKIEPAARRRPIIYECILITTIKCTDIN